MTITLDADWIADISMDTYSVAADPPGNTSASCISQARYSRYLAIISNSTYGRLALDNLLNSDGSLKTGAEPLAALLICDLIQSGPITNLGIKSEKFEDTYSYTISDDAANTVKSGFMAKYEALLTTMKRGVFASSGTVRKDYEIEFAKLSQGTPSRVEDSSSNYPTV